uniref:hybrid sensor histidine kinase/response regulator transcription factor n=1 Tax=Prevotella sp. TaxID=59823 RepID=UPI0040277547
MTRHLIIYIALFIAVPCMALGIPLRFSQPVTLPSSNDVLCMMLDKKGLLWIGTTSGLKSYDGYTVHDYHSLVINSQQLPSNTINCMAEGNEDLLWIGTRDGLVCLDRRTGEWHTVRLPGENQRVIYCLSVTSDGSVWVGTDGGLTCYNPKTKRLHNLDGNKMTAIDSKGQRHRLGYYSVKSILDDKKGNLFIGTWHSGLLRYDRKTHLFYQYPMLNDRQSAHTLFFDHLHRLWVGTWCRGMVRLDRPYDYRNPQIHAYPYSPQHFDTYYQIVEDPLTHTLWACSREGVSVLDLKSHDAQWQNMTMGGTTPLDFSYALATNGRGDLWIATMNNGIVQVNTRTSLFHNWTLGQQNHLPISAVLSLCTTDDRYFWLGLRPYGLALYDRVSGKTVYGRSIPGFASLPQNSMTAKIPSIIRRDNGEIWFGSSSYGVTVRQSDGQTRLMNNTNTPFLHDNYICILYEDRDHRVWIGQRSGISVMLPDGHGYFLHLTSQGKNLTDIDVRGITQTHDSKIWLATDNEGIIVLDGHRLSAARIPCRQYSPGNSNFDVNEATQCYEDSHHNLWTISSNGGLFRYDPRRDVFLSMRQTFNVYADQAYTINEDNNGDLWLTTEIGLLRLSVHDNQHADVVCYTQEDGIDHLLFSPNGVYMNGGEMYYGSRAGFFSFCPDSLKNASQDKTTGTLLVTDILIDGESLAQLESVRRCKISTEMPSFTKVLNIPNTVRKIGVELALLSYSNVNQNRYAYFLAGYDRHWVYGTDRQVIYQNLPSGTYRLKVKAANSQGQWQMLPYTITLNVLPPWYATWWAMILWGSLAIIAVLIGMRMYEEHVKTNNRLQMAVIFTNITHDLLTPLTVISATMDEMCDRYPGLDDYCQRVQSNISHITRQLRQILEVRKSQAGQLKLLVSNGDLTDFMNAVCDDLKPLEHLHHNQMVVDMPERHVTGWFDTDKVETILTNLISNAIKYNKEYGQVRISLKQEKGNAVITVSDEGIGISKDKMKRLYTRFLDGDYRAMNLHGTGIGLSLVHDLVKLHHGSITCQSQEGVGTTFTITLPLKRDAYLPEEISEQTAVRGTKQKPLPAVTAVTIEKTNSDETNRIMEEAGEDSYKILIVEDNDELLQLLGQLLGKYYQVKTARNGQQAWNMIQREELDLVVSDVMMPVMDGVELTRCIKESKDYAQLPVILLTAKTSDEDRDAGYHIGADDYIVKPFKLESLRLHIDSIIANRMRIREKFYQRIESRNDIADNDEKQTEHYSSPEQVFLTKATDCVRQHFNDSEFDRETFAREMLVSSSTLYNKLRALTGMGIVDFINHIRLEEAQRILENEPNISIADLSSRVGFNTPRYFSRLYKKYYGHLPKEQPVSEA